MPVQKNWEAPRTSSSYPALPGDIYQVFIEDAIIEKGKAFKSEEEIEQIRFTFQILDKAFLGRKIWKRVTPVISAGGGERKPANFNLVYEAVFKKTPYDDQLKNINADIVNNFIGKQLRLTLRKSTSAEGKEGNKIEAYLPVKEEMSLPSNWKPPVIPDLTDDGIPVIEEDTPHGEGEIDLADIPF